MGHWKFFVSFFMMRKSMLSSTFAETHEILRAGRAPKRAFISVTQWHLVVPDPRLFCSGTEALAATQALKHEAKRYQAAIYFSGDWQALPLGRLRA